MNFYPKYHLCRSCKHARVIKNKGFVCNITQKKPNFHIVCYNFLLNKIRDEKVKHNGNNFYDQTIAIIILSVFATIILTFLTKSIIIIILFILGGIFYYNFFHKNKKNIYKELGWNNYFILVFSYIIVNNKANKSNSDFKIIQQYLIRLSGNKIAEKTLEYFNNQLDKNINYELLSEQIIKNQTKQERIFLLSFLFELYFFENTENYKNISILEKLKKVFQINKQEFEFIKRNNIKKERKEQNKNYKYKNRKKAKIKITNKKIAEYFAILGLNLDVSNQEIKKKFRLLANKYHPDKNIHNKYSKPEQHTSKFQEILNAYEKIKKERNIK